MTLDALRDVPVLRLEECSPNVSGLTLAAYLAPEELRPAAAKLLGKAYFLEDVSVVEVSEGFLGVYHFDHFDAPGRIALRVLIPKDAPELPTISDIYQGASWHERECRDFFGVTFAGHENMTPLLLAAEDAEFHPLRKGDKALKSLTDLVPDGEGGPQAGDVAAFLAAAEESEAPGTPSDVTGSADGHESDEVSAT
ncbi:NADH-quinone oxidoreductase subunit C [Desulfonatronum thiodismutans]|uniref:NADH-quinone oxidoreductase subunit C n=1 Tax=Desulfonatronum thiodismutans TaxID=159290 RepID=UPI000691E23A|nr:NADH-quinone oxidoreductase subunit C [Desulfonatronum thiodismutans]